MSAGRPRDPSVDGRFIAAGVELIADWGLHRLNSDVLAQQAHSGKAAFYRRWANVDGFLVDVALALAAEPVPYPEPRTPATDLVALVLHQVNGQRGAVLTALLGRLPYNPDLRDAWLGPFAPFIAQIDAVSGVAEQLGIAARTDADARLRRGIDRLIADHREWRLLRAGSGFQPADIEKPVDELLRMVTKPVGRPA